LEINNEKETKGNVGVTPTRIADERPSAMFYFINQENHCQKLSIYFQNSGK
jgi:hypothetical protein